MTANLTTVIEGRLDIVIVNYETPDLLAACLGSIAEHRAGGVRQVIVVDNSPNCLMVPRWSVRDHPGVRLLRSTTNVGLRKSRELWCCFRQRRIRARAQRRCTALRRDRRSADPRA